MQKKFSYLENELHYAEEAKNEVAYYLNLIKTELITSQLNNPDYINLFAYSPLDSSSNLSNLAKKMYKHNPTIGAAWVNCNTYFCGLKVQDRYPYSTTLTSLSNKAICILSFKTCAALDAYVWHFSNGEINLPQIFYKYCEESNSAKINL